MRSSWSFFQRQKGTQRQHELRFQIKNVDKPDAERYLKSTNTAPNLLQRTTEPTTWRSTTGERFSLTFSTYSPRSYTGGEGWHTNWVNYFRPSLPYHPKSLKRHDKWQFPYLSEMCADFMMWRKKMLSPNSRYSTHHDVESVFPGWLCFYKHMLQSRWQLLQ